MLKLCSNCLNERNHYARGLCRECYKIPEIRYRHSRINDIRRAKKEENKHQEDAEELPRVIVESRKYPSPTDAMPGTEEKIRVMKDRYWNNQYLWHPRDGQG